MVHHSFTTYKFKIHDNRLATGKTTSQPAVRFLSLGIVISLWETCHELRFILPITCVERSRTIQVVSLVWDARCGYSSGNGALDARIGNNTPLI
uniref:Uncharacterized protein n=1 Tax=Moniliophthora roreri TaxID=221103 RepID=A0A0W0G3W0_MONRR